MTGATAPTAMAQDRLLALDTVRRRYWPDLPITRLRAWCRGGHLPAVRVGGSWWVRAAELELLLSGGAP